MEKEIVWSAVAENDLREIIYYLKGNWPLIVIDTFQDRLLKKTALLKRNPLIGVKSSTYSRFRKTLINRHYMLIYSIKGKNIVIHRIKHTKMG